MSTTTIVLIALGLATLIAGGHIALLLVVRHSDDPED